MSLRITDFFFAAACITAEAAFTFSPAAHAEDDRAFLTRSSRAIEALAKKAIPSVVAVNSVKNPLARGGEPGLGMGSGVVIHENGMILTNFHVVDHADKITVTLGKKEKYPAEVYGNDPDTDLALLKIVGHHPKLQALPFGDSDNVQVGDWAFAVGTPFGLTQSVTSGIVSAKGRGNMGMLDTEDFIQTDAAINPGNSGGPLLNSQGEVIGINTAIFSQNGGFIGVGFAIPSKIAKQVTHDIMSHRRVIRGWIGMTTQDLNSDLSAYFKVPEGGGALISDVNKNSPASNAKLEAGDVIVKFNGRGVDDATHLKTLVRESPLGRVATLEFWRSGKKQTREIMIREQPQAKEANHLDTHQMAGRTPPRAPRAGNKSENFGMSVQDIPNELAAFLGLSSTKGALVSSVQVGSPASEAGLSPGDIILSANQKDVRGAREFNKLLNALSATEPAVLFVQRGPDEKVFIPLKPIG